MAHYMMKYKGTYRVLPELDQETSDFPRNKTGEIADGYDDLYIPCRNGARIYCYGHYPENKMTMWLTAYVPSSSIGRRNNKGWKTVHQLENNGVEIRGISESDAELLFNFRAKNMPEIEPLLHPVTSGKNISPFSIKNLPKAKYEIPLEDIAKYKDITRGLKQSELILINRITEDFLKKKLERSLKKNDKSFNYITDMKMMKMGRQRKEYIHSKGLWDEYISYLDKELNKTK